MGNTNVTVIDLRPGKITVEPSPDARYYIARNDIAAIANSLLLALNGGPEAAGVVMLAQGCGCTIKSGRQ